MLSVLSRIVWNRLKQISAYTLVRMLVNIYQYFSSCFFISPLYKNIAICLPSQFQVIKQTSLNSVSQFNSRNRDEMVGFVNGFHIL